MILDVERSGVSRPNCPCIPYYCNSTVSALYRRCVIPQKLSEVTNLALTLKSARDTRVEFKDARIAASFGRTIRVAQKPVTRLSIVRYLNGTRPFSSTFSSSAQILKKNRLLTATRSITVSRHV